MKLHMGKCEFEPESKYLTLQLRESSALLGDAQALRERMAEDGFLFIRGLHDREEVLQVRRGILERMAQAGQLDPAAPLLDGAIRPDTQEAATTSVRGHDYLKTDALKRLLYGPRVLGFFEHFLGGEPTGLQFQWLRTAGRGASSGIHYDVVYMGRGTRNLYTCWTPLGDITPEMGPLALCLGSNRWQRVLETYGKTDVDRDLTEGIFSKDPAELVDRFGGRWATTDFRAGDVLIQSIFILHGSLTNLTSRFRISCDARYQLKSEPMDERWAGSVPKGHSAFWKAGAQLEPLEVSRQKWSV